jgi:hypothetical protein
MTVRKKKKRLPHNYLEKYLGIELHKADYEFIVGCLKHQKNYFQLNNIQWDIIKKIEKKYLTKI